MKTRHYIELAILVCVLVASSFRQAQGPTAVPLFSPMTIVVSLGLGLLGLDLISAVWRISRLKKR